MQQRSEIASKMRCHRERQLLYPIACRLYSFIVDHKAWDRCTAAGLPDKVWTVYRCFEGGKRQYSEIDTSRLRCVARRLQKLGPFWGAARLWVSRRHIEGIAPYCRTENIFGLKPSWT